MMIYYKKNSISSRAANSNSNDSGWKDEKKEVDDYKPKDNNKTKILLVDDDKDINITLRKVFLGRKRL
jgi:hypothetical protein